MEIAVVFPLWTLIIYWLHRLSHSRRSAPTCSTAYSDEVGHLGVEVADLPSAPSVSIREGVLAEVRKAVVGQDEPLKLMLVGFLAGGPLSRCQTLRTDSTGFPSPLALPPRLLLRGLGCRRLQLVWVSVPPRL
jgi:hypothetical protein